MFFLAGEDCKIYDETAQQLKIATRKGTLVKIAQRESTEAPILKNRKITTSRLLPSIEGLQ